MTTTITINEIYEMLASLNKKVDRQEISINKIMREVKNASPDNDMLKIKEVAKMLKKSPSTIRRWISEEKIVGIKLNKGRKQDHYLISKESVEKLINDAKI